MTFPTTNVKIGDLQMQITTPEQCELVFVYVRELKAWMRGKITDVELQRTEQRKLDIVRKEYKTP